jgi:hypothetical protein
LETTPKPKRRPLVRWVIAIGIVIATSWLGFVGAIVGVEALLLTRIAAIGLGIYLAYRWMQANP